MKKWTISDWIKLIANIFLGIVAIVTLITLIYGYIGGRFLEINRLSDAVEKIKKVEMNLSAHAQNQDLHTDSLENEKIKNTVSKEVFDMRLDVVAAKLEILRGAMERIEKQHEDIKQMFVAFMKREDAGRRQ